MNANHSTAFRALWTALLVVLLLHAPLRAEQFGIFYYVVNGDNTVSITGCLENTVGAINIPAMINGRRVTAVGGFEPCRGLTSVSIPEGVTSVASGAFRFLIGLTSVSVPESVTSIGVGAFYGCRGLTSFSIPGGVTFIGDGAFSNCAGLSSISIPAGVTSISSGVFYGCAGLSSITIPAGVTAIGDGAFSNCAGLSSISTIPAGVTSIGESAFAQCMNLTAIHVSPLNPNYSSLDGVLFNKNRTTLVQVPGGKTGPYAIPESVTTIGGAAFQGCRGLTSVSIPEGITGIGPGMFLGCSRLTSVSIPGSVTSIGAEAFTDCVSLTSVSIPGSVTSIASSTFFRCTGLISVSIPASVTTIDVGAFEGCSSLISVFIPASVTTLGDPAFGGCTSLTAINVDPLNPNYSSLDGALMDKNRTRLIQYPAGRAGAWSIPASVTEIPDSAFFGCTGLTSIAIPHSVTRIKSRAFQSCTSLTSITIPDSVTSIEGTTFTNCTSLASVTVGSGLTELGGSAFEGCTGLTSVSLGSNIIKLNGGSFAGCTSLTSIAIPDSVTSIEWGAFQGCTGLTSVTIPDSVTLVDHYAFTGCTSLASVTIGGGVSFIGWNAFAGCTSLTSVAIPNSVTMIGDWAFDGCTSLTSVSIGSGVIEIGWWAFQGCTALTSITIPPNVTIMDVDPFLGCTGLTAIEVSPQNPIFSSLDGVLFNKARTTLIRFPSQWGGTYSVPNTVLEIYGGAFQDCPALTSVSIPASVTTIGVGVFVRCPALGRIDVAAANPAYSSLDGVLFNKARTRLVRYPGAKAGPYAIPGTVTAIGGWALANCTGLTSVTIPGGVTVIELCAFLGCTGLTSITFPNSVTTIGQQAFENCTGLTNVSIPNSVTLVVYGAFRGCTGLASVSIGRGVTDIGNEVFLGCTGLTGFTVDAQNSKYRSIDGVLFWKSPFKLLQVPALKAGHYSIPNGVIGLFNYNDGPFDHCAALTSVFIPASVADHNRISLFRGCRKLTTITVDPANQHYRSLDGVLFNKTGTTLIRFPAGRAGNCTVPAGVNYIEYDAFEGCTGLHSLLFLGDNPNPDPITFADTAPGFTLYYFRGSLGFTSPTWLGYPSVMIDRGVHPAAEWLINHDLPYDADLQDDLNGDGVNLLMAYALDLNPNLNLAASLPVPLLGSDTLSLSFYGATSGVIYAGETSTDLRYWTTAGVTLSAPGPDGRRTASVARDGPARYLRLLIQSPPPQ